MVDDVILAAAAAALNTGVDLRMDDAEEASSPKPALRWSKSESTASWNEDRRSSTIYSKEASRGDQLKTRWNQDHLPSTTISDEGDRQSHSTEERGGSHLKQMIPLAAIRLDDLIDDLATADDDNSTITASPTFSPSSSPTHYGTKPGHFETSKIHFPTSEGVSEVTERANE